MIGGGDPYRVSVLQIGSFDNEILDLESSWKVKLMTRDSAERKLSRGRISPLSQTEP
jgi:hypothetical protein